MPRARSLAWIRAPACGRFDRKLGVAGPNPAGPAFLDLVTTLSVPNVEVQNPSGPASGLHGSRRFSQETATNVALPPKKMDPVGSWLLSACQWLNVRPL